MKESTLRNRYGLEDILQDIENFEGLQPYLTTYKNNPSLSYRYLYSEFYLTPLSYYALCSELQDRMAFFVKHAYYSRKFPLYAFMRVRVIRWIRKSGPLRLKVLKVYSKVFKKEVPVKKNNPTV